MLISDLRIIGNNIYKIRKSKGMTQAEVAEKADLSDRTFADIERGSATMRIDSLLKICAALYITPNDILVSDSDNIVNEDDIYDAIKNCSPTEKDTALKLLKVYIDSIK